MLPVLLFVFVGAGDLESVVKKAESGRAGLREVVLFGSAGADYLLKKNLKGLLMKCLKEAGGMLAGGAREAEAAEGFLREAARVEQEAVEKVLKEKAEGEGVVAKAAARLLAQIHFRVSRELLRRTGITMADWHRMEWRQKVETVHRLEKLGGKEATETLKVILKEEKDERVLGEAANALVRTGGMGGLAYIRKLGLNRLVRKLPDRYALLMGQGMEFLDAGNYKEALQQFQEVLKELPGDFAANYWAGLTCLYMKRYMSAVNFFKTALKAKPKNYLAHYNLACAYALLGLKEKALEHLEKSIENGYDDPDHMANDEDLKLLRDDPRFRRLLDMLRRRQGEKR